jgi:hypothetical protein
MAMIDTSIDKTTIPVQDEGNDRRHDLVAQKMSVSRPSVALGGVKDPKQFQIGTKNAIIVGIVLQRLAISILYNRPRHFLVDCHTYSDLIQVSSFFFGWKGVGLFFHRLKKPC